MFGPVFRARDVWGYLCLLSLAGAAGCLIIASPEETAVAAGGTLSIVLNEARFASFWEWTSIAVGMLFTLMAFDSQNRSESAPEWFGGLLLAVSGMLMASRADNLAELFVAVELATLPIVLNIFDVIRRSVRAAVMTQLRIHLLSSALLFFGFCLLAAFAGSTSFPEIRAALAVAETAATAALPTELQSAVLVLILAAVGCRLALIPFQPAIADMYDASRIAEAGLLSTSSLVVGLIVVVRVLIDLMPASASTGQLLTIVLSAASMFIGSALAFNETRIKRIVAYLFIANAGFALIGISTGFADVAAPERSLVAARSLPGGVETTLFHAATFLAASGGLMSVLVYLGRRGGEIEHVEDLAGIVSRESVAAMCAAVSLLSLAGIPPLPGFWAKLFLLASGLSVHLESQRGFLPHPNPAFLLLAMVVAGSVVMASATWLRILAAIFLDGQVARPEPSGGQPALAVAMLTTMLLIGMGILPGPLLGYLDGIVEAPAAIVGTTNGRRASASTLRESRKVPDGGNEKDIPVPRARPADHQP